MRQIKFRAWDKKYKEWFLRWDEVPTIMTPPLNIMEFSNEESSLILEQFTGLTDKNNKEIYEGDILNSDLFDDFDPFVMAWSEKNNGWAQYGPKDTFEVIGNIHENPELLNE